MKKVLTFVLCIVAIVCICGLLSVNAEAQEPELTIAACNLSLLVEVVLLSGWF